MIVELSERNVDVVVKALSEMRLESRCVEILNISRKEGEYRV
jgi:hypothetical protein